MEKSFKDILMNGIGDMIFVLKVEDQEEYRYEFINTAVMERCGLTDDILGLTIRDVYQNEKADFLYKQYDEVIKNKSVHRYEDTYTLEEIHYSETTLTPLYNAKGVCERIVAVVKDITKETAALSYVKDMMEKLAESNERFHSLFFHNSDGIFILNKHGYITDGNEATETITGYKVTELVGKSIENLVETDSVSTVKNIIEEAGNGTNTSVSLTIKHKNDQLLNITFKVIPLIIDGDVIGLYGMLKDVTEHMKNIEMLEESEKRFRIIAENAHDLITVINKQGEITYVSPSYKNILGFDHQEFIGKHFIHNIHSDDLGRLIETVGKSIQTDEPFTIEFRQKHSNGEMLWCESIGNPVFNQKGKFQHLVALTRDITLRKEYEAKLKHFAYHDALTGLPNRLLFKERFTIAKEQFLTNNNGLALIILDVDHFKRINDTYGHDVGDMIIREFGLRIKESIRDHDTVARLGGDEFVILLSSIQHSENALEIAERIKSRMEEPWEVNGQTLHVTTSMGIAMAPLSQSFTKSDLMKKADIALYQAKDNGRNSYQLYTDPL